MARPRHCSTSSGGCSRFATPAKRVKWMRRSRNRSNAASSRAVEALKESTDLWKSLWESGRYTSLICVKKDTYLKLNRGRAFLQAPDLKRFIEQNHLDGRCAFPYSLVVRRGSGISTITIR